MELKNTDTTLHNVHALPAANAESNHPQPQGTAADRQDLRQAGGDGPLQCDIHPWMVAYVGVVPHPYYAVSGEDGAFSIKNLPPGKYTLEAWHEKLGTQTQEVTVAPGRTVDGRSSTSSRRAP